MTPAEALALALLETLAEQVGLPLVLRWLASKTPEEQAQALLSAEYAAIRQATDAEAAAALKP